MATIAEGNSKNDGEWTEVAKNNIRKELVKVVHQKVETGKREKNIIL